VSHGVTGRIVPPAAVEALAASMISLATEPALSKAMGRAGRLAAETQYSLQTMTAAYRSLYDSQLKARGVPDRAPAHSS